MNPQKLKLAVSLMTVAAMLLAAGKSHAYEVWFGLPYMPRGSEDRLDEWNLSAQLLQGINTNTSDTQRPAEERNSNADWKAIVESMPTAKENAVLEFARTHFNYGTVTHRGSLEEALVVKFRRERNFGLSIKWVMPFDNQPGEDRTLPIYQWSDAELQRLRDWLDSNGHADVKLLLNARNFSVRTQSFAKKPIMDGISIEAQSRLWYDNAGRRQDLLKWALDEPATRDGHFKFQVPFGHYDRADGVRETPFQAMRGFMRWLSTSAMLGSTDFIRRDDVTFMVIVYDDNAEHLPEKSADGTRYENTLLSLALSLIEQKELFEGRNGELISKAQTMSYERTGLVESEPVGLVAHWPMDEGTGVTTANVAGTSYTAELLNGASWGSDDTRDSYVVFDGENDRIETTFTYALSKNEGFTWTWWANKQSVDGSDTGSIMVGNRYGGLGSESLEFIKFMPLKATFVNGGLDDREDYDYANITNDGWHHYAMVKTGELYQWYVDGHPQGSPLTIDYTETDRLPFKIGGDDDNDSPGGREAEHFTGFIDDVALYDRSLTPAEVQAVRDGKHAFLSPDTSQEGWREFYFGIAQNFGIGADNFDANRDGESNLLEFATGQDPFAATVAQTSVTVNRAILELRYSQNVAAVAEGVEFVVKWSDNLMPLSWSSIGITDVAIPPDPGNPGARVINERIATLPIGTGEKRFIRLEVSKP